jgi:hypothetical protein
MTLSEAHKWGITGAAQKAKKREKSPLGAENKKHYICG